MKGSNIVKIGAIAVFVLGFIMAGILLTQNWGKSSNILSHEAAMRKLDNLYSRLVINRLTPKQDPDYQGYDESAERFSVLPDISEYPFIVNPTTDDFLTIYSSTEKADWLVDVANRFNQSGPTVDGRSVSVGIRAIPSGLGADFISSGKYTPDVYAPSSGVYGDMLAAHGIGTNLVEGRIAGNVGGVVITKTKRDDLSKKYGDLDSAAVIESVLASQLALGYTSPLSNEDGFNFILTLLAHFDGNNPTSAEAVTGLRKFQDKILFISYDSDQLKAALTGGTLDAIVMNHQAYAGSPSLRSSYEFIPIGVRQDNPIYEVGDLSPIKKQITAAFVDFCKSAESQGSASDRGFNAFDSYPGAETINGAAVLRAQEIYKKEKGGTSDLTAIFVADISGSMEGSPLLNLKASLHRAVGVIDSNANIGLITFSDTVNIAVPIARFDNAQRAYFGNAIRSMNAGGGTAMFDAIVVAQKMLTDAKERNPNTRLMLFVLTDGESNRGYSFEDIEGMTAGLRIPVYTIGYNANIDILQKLSDINEAATMNADSDNIIYRIESLFNSQF